MEALLPEPASAVEVDHVDAAGVHNASKTLRHLVEDRRVGIGQEEPVARADLQHAAHGRAGSVGRGARAIGAAQATCQPVRRACLRPRECHDLVADPDYLVGQFLRLFGQGQHLGLGVNGSGERWARQVVQTVVRDGPDVGIVVTDRRPEQVQADTQAGRVDSVRHLLKRLQALGEAARFDRVMSHALEYGALVEHDRTEPADLGSANEVVDVAVPVVRARRGRKQIARPRRLAQVVRR